MRSVVAGIAEDAVVGQLRAVLSRPEIIASAARAAQEDAPDVAEQQVLEALRGVNAVWDTLFPLEQARIVQLLVETVVVTTDGLSIRVRTNGLRGLVQELQGIAENSNGRQTQEAS